MRCADLHFGDPHHEMNLGLTAPVIFRVAGAGGHRERGKAEGDGKFFLHGMVRPTRAFEAGAPQHKAPSVSVQYDTGEEKFCCLTFSSAAEFERKLTIQS